jgi:outer membrane protein assembly factor BamA
MTNSATAVPVGGDVYFSFNLEERFPLTRSRSVELIVFQDGGNVYLRKGQDVDGLDRGFDPVIRTSVGLGLRVRTPVGPLRLDGGIQLGSASPLFDRNADEPWWRGMAIHFSVGEQ